MEKDQKLPAAEPEKKPKTRAQMIIDGDIEPEPHERGLLNLRKRVPFNEMPPEKMHEIAVKGGEAVQKLHGEKKTAKQSIEKILTLKIDEDIIAGADIPPEVVKKIKRDNPEATLYDLIQAVAVGKALEGSIRAAEYVRDTHGDKPQDSLKIEADIMTEADRAMISKMAARLDDPELVIVQDVTGKP